MEHEVNFLLSEAKKLISSLLSYKKIIFIKKLSGGGLYYRCDVCGIIIEEKNGEVIRISISQIQPYEKNTQYICHETGSIKLKIEKNRFTVSYDFSNVSEKEMENFKWIIEVFFLIKSSFLEKNKEEQELTLGEITFFSPSGVFS